MFGALTRGIKNQIVDKAVQELSSNGIAHLEGIGVMLYDYKDNKLSVTPAPKLLERIRESYKLKHKVD